MLQHPMAADTTQWIMAMNHPLRRQLLRIVRETGTVDVDALCRSLELPRGIVGYHLRVLADLDRLLTTSAASATHRRDGSSRR